jgi:ribosome-binding factor A
MSHNNSRLAVLISEQAAKFVSENATRQSLITITSVVMSKDGREATIYFTVLPETEEVNALNFLKKSRSDFYHDLTETFKGRRIPLVDFKIDAGEKSRQNLDRAILDDKLARQ